MQVNSVVTYGITHKADGQIPAHSSLKMSFVGSLSNLVSNPYFSLVATTLTTPYSPCLPFSGYGGLSYAGSATGSSASGSAVASSNLWSLNTWQLDSTKTFALCYASLTGTSADTTWQDSGIRLFVSEISSIDIPSGYTGILPSCVQCLNLLQH